MSPPSVQLCASTLTHSTLCILPPVRFIISAKNHHHHRFHPAPPPRFFCSLCSTTSSHTHVRINTHSHTDYGPSAWLILPSRGAGSLSSGSWWTWSSVLLCGHYSPRTEANSPTHSSCVSQSPLCTRTRASIFCSQLHVTSLTTVSGKFQSFNLKMWDHICHGFTTKPACPCSTHLIEPVHWQQPGGIMFLASPDSPFSWVQKKKRPLRKLLNLSQIIT